VLGEERRGGAVLDEVHGLDEVRVLGEVRVLDSLKLIL
jgi:hypothetical protein